MSLRENAQRLLSLLTEVRDAKPDARGFAWFDRRDDLMKAGVPRAYVDGFDPSNNAALEQHIAKTRAAARGSDIWPAFAEAGGDALFSPPAVNLNQPGPSWVARATRIAGEEELRAAKRAKMAGVGLPHNNRFDAERHARWTYRMAKELGPTLATIAGIGHEIGGIAKLQPLGEALMDLHNNGVGIGQARAGGGMPNRDTPELKWMRQGARRYAQ